MTKKRGLQNLVLDALANDQLPIEITALNLMTKIPGWDRAAYNSTLMALKNKGVLNKVGYGRYMISADKGMFKERIPDSQSPVEVIENLLSAMADAEPALIRAKKLFMALESADA